MCHAADYRLRFQLQKQAIGETELSCLSLMEIVQFKNNPASTFLIMCNLLYVCRFCRCTAAEEKVLQKVTPAERILGFL